MEKKWNEQILSIASDTSVFAVLERQTESVPLLSEAARFYVEMKDRAEDKRFVR